MGKLYSFLLLAAKNGGQLPDMNDPGRLKWYKVFGIVVIMGSGVLTYYGKLTSSDFAAILFFVLPSFGFGVKQSGNKNGGSHQNKN